MRLLDSSPGGFITFANLVLYATVGLECWMLTTGSMLAMAGVLSLIVTLAILICRWALHLMGPEDHALDYEPRSTEAMVVTAPRPAPSAERAGRHGSLA